MLERELVQDVNNGAGLDDIYDVLLLVRRLVNASPVEAGTEASAS